jgi:hypothetical protein
MNARKLTAIAAGIGGVAILLLAIPPQFLSVALLTLGVVLSVLICEIITEEIWPNSRDRRD